MAVALEQDTQSPALFTIWPSLVSQRQFVASQSKHVYPYNDLQDLHNPPTKIFPLLSSHIQIATGGFTDVSNIHMRHD